MCKKPKITSFVIKWMNDLIDQLGVAENPVSIKLDSQNSYMLFFTLQNFSIFYCTFPYSIVLSRTFLYSPVLSSTLQYSPVLSSILQFSPPLSRTLQYSPVISSALQYFPVLSSNLQYSPILTMFRHARPWPSHKLLIAPNGAISSWNSLFFSYSLTKFAIMGYKWKNKHLKL